MIELLITSRFLDLNKYLWYTKNMTDPNSSILDQIIHKKQAQENASFRPEEVLIQLFKPLSAREKDILNRRFSLLGESKQTLEEIGRAHNITRERIRQLIADSIKKIQKKEDFSSQIKPLKKTVSRLLEKYGGVMEEDLLLEMLESLGRKSDAGQEEGKDVLKNEIKFIISELFDDEFIELKEADLKECWRLKLASIDLLRETLSQTEEILKEKNHTLTSEELVQEFKAKTFFADFQARLPMVEADFPNFRIAGFDPDRKLSPFEEVFLSYLLISDRIRQNVFGQWGLKDWNTISPKRMNDKIYLLLKKINKPLHYREIAKQINEIKFDKKQANAETIHNELIMDSRYVLVGRGIYALKEWGYQKGTVAEVVVGLLKKEGPLTKKEIVRNVLDQRIVKEATIQLALMNKTRFERLEDGRYSLVVDAPAEPLEEAPAQEVSVEQNEESSNPESQIPNNN